MGFNIEVFLLVAVLTAVFGIPVENISSFPSNSTSRVQSYPERSGRFLKEWVRTNKKGNPEEQGEYFEGDIIVPEIEARNGIILCSSKWKDAKIPYEILGSFSQNDKIMLSNAIEQFHMHTCIRFFPRSGEKDYVVFDNTQTGCWSPIGRVGGTQTVNLQTPGCLGKIGTAIHEILHTIGFYHEQNRYDRDDYVRVIFKNIQGDKLNNFEKLSKEETTVFNIPYDYESVLHYSPFAFSTSDKKTIEARNDQAIDEKMGQREGFSQKDIEKINAMYC